MRDVLRGLAIGLVLLVLLGALASRLGAHVDVPRPAGTGPWLLSRATGITAFVALSLDVIVGLAMSTRLGDRWLSRAASVDLHGWLSAVALALVAGHALVLLADRYIRFDLIDVIVPFASGYRPLAVALGVTAGYLAVAVHVSFGLRRRIGTRAWRRLHYLSFAALVAAAGHAVLAGSDTAHPWVGALYATPLVIICALLAYRVTHRRARSAPA